MSGCRSNRSADDESNTGKQPRGQNRCRVGDIVQFLSSWHKLLSALQMEQSKASPSDLPSLGYHFSLVVKPLVPDPVICPLKKRSSYSLFDTISVSHAPRYLVASKLVVQSKVCYKNPSYDSSSSVSGSGSAASSVQEKVATACPESHKVTR